MTSFDDKRSLPEQPLQPVEQDAPNFSSGTPNTLPTAPLHDDQSMPTAPETTPTGDPIFLAAANSSVQPGGVSENDLGGSLNLGLYWLHFVIFGVFSFVSLIVVQLTLLSHYLPLQTIFTDQKKVERIIFTKPLVSIGTMVLLYGLVLLFLYVTLAVLRRAPFWRSLGWKKISLESHWPKSPWLYFGAGVVLSLLITLATATMQPPKDAPIEELLSNKNAALLFMAMAVLVAPLVEETVFRGYLYPLFAKSFGVAASIVLTGTLFGVLHGAQLGWSWGLVLALIAVGVTFTFVRARTDSVFASFLLHLGYNSTLALFAVLGSELTGKFSPR